MTRQRAYQLRHLGQGLCIKCVLPRSPRSKHYCEEHRQRANELNLQFYYRRKAKAAGQTITRFRVLAARTP